MFIPLNDNDIRAILKRQETLMKHAPPCPTCASEQVKLIFQQKPARWKCRHCKHHFTSEPENS